MTSVEPRVYQAVAIAKALKFYANHKMMVNRAYTPINMLKTAASITGKSYKRGEYMKAHDDIMAKFVTSEDKS